MSASILLIDDDESVLEMMRLVLESEGYHVHTSLLVFEDLKEIEQLHLDLIILDFKIRGRENTWTFLQKLKLFPPTSAIPLVLCTAALKDVREQESILREKGIPVLYKPFDLKDFLFLVQTSIKANFSTRPVAEG